MKYWMLLEIFNRLKSKPNFKRKFKIFLIIGSITFVMISGLIVWAGVSVYQFAKIQVQAVNVPVSVEKIESQIKTLPGFNFLNCWNKAQNLMSVEVWLSHPMAQNLNELKIACLQSSSTKCEGTSCSKDNTTW